MTNALYIDDCEDDREAAARAFGPGLDTVASIATALPRISVKDYDVIISDVMMSRGADGFVLMRELERRGIKIPVVLTSGVEILGEEFDEYEGSENYIGFVPKPVTPENVNALIKKREHENGH